MFRIRLVRLGQTMEHGTIVRWLKQAGDSIEVGEELYEIETEKTVVPVQATRPGVLARIVAGDGDTVEVGSVLAIVAEAGDQPTAAEMEAFVRRDAELLPDDPAPTLTVPPSAGVTRAERAAAQPKARVLARELDIDLSTVSGTGPDGLITVGDVRRAAVDDGGNRLATSESRVLRRVPFTTMQRATIKALETGWQTPQFTQATIIDATSLVSRKRAAGGALSYMDYFLEAIVQAARDRSEVLARVVGEEILYYDSIDLTIATDTLRGLMIPVLRNAGAFDITARREAWRGVTERARAGMLAPDDLSGGLIAVSNLGARGVDYGTALLPTGHAAIAFFGALESRALIVNGRVKARPAIHVSITYDHRIIDGAQGSRFTSAVKAALQS